MFRQSRAAIEVLLGNIWANWGEALVTVVGVAGVVGVLVTVLAMAQGFRHVLTAGGRADRAIILAKGAPYEASSNISRDAALRTIQSRGIKRAAGGAPMVSMETLTQLRLRSISGDARAVTVRGVGPMGMQLRPEVRIIGGRMFRPGLHELIVGRSLIAEIKGLETGGRVTLQSQTWVIVGLFAVTGGGQLDSEIMGDAVALQSASHRSDFQDIMAELADPAALAELSSALAADPSLSVDVHREDQYYADQSRTFVRILTIVGFFVAGVMAVGAVFAALNTMYAAVAKQSTLIATLRALGFGAGAVTSAVFAESLLLSLLGAALGGLIAVALFQGHIFRVTPGAQSDLFYALQISPGIALLGTFWALAIGFLGGLFPAIRAARLSIIDALRIT